MKKYINKFLVLLVALTIMQSCSTDDKTVDSVFEGVTSGAVLRTLNSTDTFNFYDPNDSRFVFNISLEEQDAQNGNLISEIRLYQSFKDNLEDNVNNSKDEVLILTKKSEDLTVSDFNLPQLDFSATLEDALTNNNLSTGQYNGGDSFSFRFEVELTDGRIFTNSNVTGTVSGGSFYQSPFIYTVNLQCIPLTPFPGEYTLDLKGCEDDGWDGAFITVTIDGSSTDYTTTVEETQHVITVPNGTTELKFSYTSGKSDGNNTYTIDYDAMDGSDPIEAADNGPSPPEGEIFLDICL